MTTPSLTGFGGTVIFAENTVNAAPQILDSDVTVTGDGNFAGGTLTVSNLSGDDVVTILTEGSGPGEIAVNGTDVLFDGALIASFTGGAGADLVVTFADAVTTPAIEALIERLAFSTPSDTPVTSRTLLLTLEDANGVQAYPFGPLEAIDITLLGVTFPAGDSAPAFVDLDGDGDLDLVVGERNGTLAVFDRNSFGGFAALIGPDNPFDGITANGASNPGFVDLDGDGDPDMVLGAQDGTLRFFENTEAGFVERTETANPFDGIDSGSFSAPAFFDVDGDRDADLVLGQNDGTLALFENTGTGFVQRTGADNPFSGIDVGRYSAPAFVDVDGDGDADLVLGQEDGGLSVFENTAAGWVELTGDDNPFTDIDVGTYSIPAFSSFFTGGLDLLVGQEDGTLDLFFNRGFADIGRILVGITPQAEPPTLDLFTTTYFFFENTVNATPQLLDTSVTFATGIPTTFAGGTLTVTGLLAEDTVAVRDQGSGPGNIWLFENAVVFGDQQIGTVTGGVGSDLIITFTGVPSDAAIEALIENLTYANSSDDPTPLRELRLNITSPNGADLTLPPQFVTKLGTNNPFFEDIDVGFYSSPTLADLDGDGDLDLVVGDRDGTLSFFANQGGVFVERTGDANPFGGISLGDSTRIAPNFADLDGDGDLDLVIARGSALLEFRNEAGIFANVLDSPSGLGALNEGTNVNATFGDVDGDGDPDMVLGRLGGLLSYYENVGGVFTLRAPADSPLGPIGVASGFVDPTLVDLDGDGDLDLAVGTDAVGLTYFENTGTGFVGQSLADNPFDGVTISNRLRTTFGDLDGDGDVDGVFGTRFDGVGFLENSGPRGIALSVEVLAQSEAPVLSFFDTRAVFAENTVNATPQILDPDVSFIDPNGDLDGGTLTVTGLLPEDILSVRDQGSGAGQIGFDPIGEVFFEGLQFATLTGGAGSPLVVTFDARATSAAVDALIENLTYANTSNQPTLSRELILNVTDAEGNDLSDHPEWLLRIDADNPFDGIDVGDFANGDLADLDGNGRLDLITGNEDGDLILFEFDSTGFVPKEAASNPFTGIDLGDNTYSAPTFVDLDGDGDLDLVVGVRAGGLFVFQNDAGAFSQLVGTSLDAVLVSGFATPDFGDFDGDGDVDLLVGNGDGTLSAFENTGGTFTELTGADNPFDGFTVGAYSDPELVDLDGDGDLDLIVGDDEIGTLTGFENTGTDFVRLTGTQDRFAGFNEVNGSLGTALTPIAFDYTGDGTPDLAIGTDNGTFLLFENSEPRGQRLTVDVTAERDAPPTLTGFPPSVFFLDPAVTTAQQLLFPEVTFAAGTGGFVGTALTLTGLLPEDIVSVRDTGTGPGEIRLNGNDVLFEGFSIGSLTGGTGTDLTIAFTAGVTPEAIEALVQNLTYANSAEDPTNARNLRLNITDDLGGDLSPEVPFAPRTGPLNPFDGIDVGTNSRSSFADLDGDGDLDLVVGGNDGILAAYRNDSGSFTALIGAENPFDGIDVGYFSSPAFADLDGDGDLDLVVGELYGTLRLYDNKSGVFTQATGTDTPFGDINVRYFGTPALADLDGDGDLDLVMGEDFATLTVYDNEGGVFTEVIGAANLFDGMDFRRYTSPSFADLDGDGDLDLVVGDRDGTLRTYDNDGGVFTERAGGDNPFDGIDVGFFSAPSFADLDGDGDLDLLVGAEDGTLRVFENTGPRGVLFTIDVVPQDETSLPPALTGLPSSLGALEDTASDLDLSGITFSDTDTPGAISLTLTVSAGTLMAGSAGGVTLSGSGGQVLTLTGTAAAIDAYLNDPTAIQYTGAPDVFGEDAATLTLSADDGFGATGLGTVNIDIADTIDVQTGDGGPNTLTGDDGADQIFGAGGNDTISGRGGNDEIDGGPGNDTISGNAGADTIEGGEDDDTINGGIGPDTVDGGDGVDTITGADGFDTLRGGAGNDTIRGNAGNDMIFGDGGDDILNGGIGADTIEGGDDNDTINGSDGFDILSGGTGNDTINGNAGNDTIFGDAGDDILNGGIGFDTIEGGDDDDTILGLEGFDMLSGGAGADEIQGNAGNDTIDGGTGNDVLEGGQGRDTITGGAGEDTLRGQTGADILSGGADNDQLLGGEGADRLSGDGDDDTLTGGTGADVFVFDEGIDTIVDYSVIVDRIELDALALQIAGLTGVQVVQQFGEVVDGNTVLSFDTGDTLILTGITNSANVLGGTIDLFEG